MIALCEKETQTYDVPFCFRFTQHCANTLWETAFSKKLKRQFKTLANGT